ncbi:MAG: TonB-dependent receptor plug domain-containing protein [Bacteroidales bacterium]|jgi:hypothetical protein|nr:TonB-dependent receptor plug domain-containing protein [Bacteroidales bacterium]
MLTSAAQDTQAGIQQDTLRPYSVKVVDSRGKPLPGLVVSVKRRDKAFITNEKGLVEFEGISDADSIIVYLPEIGETHVPCLGTDSIQVMVRSKKRFRIQDREKLANLRANASNTIDNVPEFLKRHPARNLAELLNGQIPGLFISTGPRGLTANIRGINSINSGTEPLIVIDGMTYDSFAVVNSFLDVYSIQSIQVQKDGGLYGVRGANGVIIITTIGAASNPLSY